MKNFVLPPEYFTNIVVKHRGNYLVKRAKDGDHEALAAILAGEGEWSSVSFEDHPEFSKLRYQLRDEGFISVVEQWGNGDRVLKAFKLNGKTFKKGDKFSCAAAMASHFRKNT